MLLIYQTQWRYRMKLDDVEKAVEYLASTDEQHAKIAASQESMKDAEKHTKGKFVLEHKGNV